MNIAPFVSAASAPIELLTKDRFWVSKKTRPTQFADRKNRPGKDYAKEKEKPISENPIPENVGDSKKGS